MKNLKVRDYVKQNLNYTPLQTLKPKSSYNGFEMVVNDLTYEEVKAVMRDIGKPSTWNNIKNIFETCFRMEEEDFWNGTIVEFFAARNFIIQTFNQLIKTEQMLLSSIQNIDTMLWEQAGGAKLNRFGSILALNQLGKLYGIYPFDLKDRKYQEILLLLTIEKEKREIENEYNKLKAKIKKK